jgi:hypothetical protein
VWREYIDENIRAVREWGEKIKSLLDEGKNFIEITEYFRRRVLEEVGKRPEELPEYFRKIFLPVMVRISIMGYMATILHKPG